MRKIILLLMLFLPVLVFGQGVAVAPQTALKTVNGLTQPLANATITVCAASTAGIPCSPALVGAVFSNVALTQPLSNPFTADANGNYSFSIAPGVYTVTVTGSGFSGFSYQITASSGGGSGSSNISGLISGQVGIANSSTSLGSSKGIQGSDSNLLSSGAVSGAAGVSFCTDGGGGATTSGCPSGGLADPGSNGIVKRTALNTTAPAASADVISLFSTCSGTQYLGADGVCHNAAGSAFPITTAQQAQTGGSLSPSGVGQNVASGLIAPNGIITPAASVSSTSGGSLTSANFNVAITYVTAAGETYPSATVVPIMGSCVTTCQVTVTAPSFLPAGVTGYTVYSCQGNACSMKQQAASAACVNLAAGVNCVISTAGAGAAIPSANTAWFQPANIQTNECPGGVQPFIFTPDQSGNLHTAAGIDLNSNNSQTSGTLEFCHRTWFNDTFATPPGGNNAFVLIDHTAGTGTSTANQDRSLWVGFATPVGDVTARYALEAIQSELDYNCATCNINGSPDAEVTDASFNTTETASTHYSTANSYGTNVIRASLFKQGPGATSNYHMLNGEFVSNNATYNSGDTIDGVKFKCAGVMTNAWCYGYDHYYNTSATAWQAALITHNTPSGGATQNAVLLIDNTIPGINSLLNGPTYESQVNNSNTGAFLFSGAINLTGGQQILQNSIAGPTGVACTGGASTYQYKLVGVDANGGTVTSAVSQCSTGTNPLAGGTPATISVNFTMAQAVSFLRIDVYRISGPMTTGKIGSLSCTASTGIISNPCANFIDTGIAADGGTVPTPNTTATSFAAGYVSNSANKAFVAANFTTAANTSLQTITGLSFNLLPVAQNYQFHCALAYSQGTANAAVAFGIQAATVNPTNIFASGGMGTSTTAGTTAVLPTLATTTATTIVTATPSATATNFTAVLDGTIEEPANDAGQAINIMVSTATAADAVTVLRGSYCYLY